MSAPLIIGIGGTTRPISTCETALRAALTALCRQEAELTSSLPRIWL